MNVSGAHRLGRRETELDRLLPVLPGAGAVDEDSAADVQEVLVRLPPDREVGDPVGKIGPSEQVEGLNSAVPCRGGFVVDQLPGLAYT